MINNFKPMRVATFFHFMWDHILNKFSGSANILFYLVIPIQNIYILNLKIKKIINRILKTGNEW